MTDDERPLIRGTMQTDVGLSDGLVIEGADPAGNGYPQPGDVEGGSEPSAFAEPAKPPVEPSALSAALEKAGITPAIDNCQKALGKAADDFKAALAAKWEGDPNFRKAVMAAAAVAFVLVFFFHL